MQLAQALIYNNHDLGIVYLTQDVNNEFNEYMKDNQQGLIGNGIEVILVGSQSNASKLLDIIQLYPEINWKIYTAEPLPQYVPLRFLTELSTKKYIIFLSGRYQKFERFDACNIISQFKDEGLYRLFPNFVIVNMSQLSDSSLADQCYITHATKDQDNATRVIKIESVIGSASATNAGNLHAREVYSWYHKPFNATALSAYLSSFQQHDVKLDILQDAPFFPVVAVVAVHNEKRNIKPFLRELSGVCSAIILLDDSSSDGTYELAAGEKLIIKAQKNRDNFFNDLQNRNILLELASYVNSQWILTIDADERFDKRFRNFSKVVNSDKDVLYFGMVNLWDSPLRYRKDIKGDLSINGMFFRPKMFRNIGRSQINIWHNTLIHFPLTPYWTNCGAAEIVLLHYGMLKEEQRQQKIHFYYLNDRHFKSNIANYSYLLDTTVETDEVASIDLAISIEQVNLPFS